MSEPASEVYEIVVVTTDRPHHWFRNALTSLFGLFTMGSGVANPGGMIISVTRKSDGEELFRHIEDSGDDEDHLVDGIQKDLETMSATEFASRWTD